MALHNKINGKLLKERLHQSAQSRTTLSFYRYHHITEPAAFRDELYKSWEPLEVWGRVYVAPEGINGQVSVPSGRLDEYETVLNGIPCLQGIRLNLAVDDNGKSFFKLKIQVRKKIVADGLNDLLFDASDSGKHLNADEFNSLTDQPDTIVVDMRNHYESEIGHFQNAICPDVDTFREALPVVENMLDGNHDKNIVMYCTGGIRCEKASAWFKHRGFSNVWQLDGGIIEYTRQVAAQGLANKFIGKNFVFDERLGEKISDTVISVCHQCGAKCDVHTNCRNEACHLLFIQCENCRNKFSGCCSESCQQIAALPVEQQRELRKGKKQGRAVYKKGRSGIIRFKAS